jgi:hypothetical protein
MWVSRKDVCGRVPHDLLVSCHVGEDGGDDTLRVIATPVLLLPENTQAHDGVKEKRVSQRALRTQAQTR